MWISFYGVPAHACPESFFKKMVLRMGNLIALDESTKHKLSLDVGRALIKTSSTKFLDFVVHLKINQHLFTIRMVEEPFSETVFYPCSVKSGPNSDESSSEDSDFVLDSLMGLEAVPETLFTSSRWMA